MTETVRSSERVGHARRTVRIVVENDRGEFLMMQKSSKSRAADLWEFPGGGIDKVDYQNSVSIIDGIVRAGKRELREETGIDLPQEAFDLRHMFRYVYPRDTVRVVHMLYVRVQGRPDIVVNQTMQDGRSVDKHEIFEWVSREKLDHRNAANELSGNSQQYEPVLGSRIMV